MDHKPFNATQEDIELIAKLGFDAYRFSISWSRIFPGMCLNTINAVLLMVKRV